MTTPIPAHPDDARVYVEVSGLTGTGKSAVMGEIEIALRAIGLTVEHEADFQTEKNMTHADWQEALDLYKPTVVIRERNISRAPSPVAHPDDAASAAPNLLAAEAIMATLHENIPALDAYDEDELSSFEASVAQIIADHFPSRASPPSSARELKPCPFCGGDAEIIELDDGDNAGGSCVACTQCRASGNVEFGRKENYVSNWNRRATPPSDLRLDRAVEALERARDALHQHYVDWDGEPEDAVPLQLARSECDQALAAIRSGDA